MGDRRRPVPTDRRGRCERSFTNNLPAPDGGAERCRSGWRRRCCAERRLRPRLSLDRWPPRYSWAVLPGYAGSLPLLARACLKLLAPRYCRNQPSCAARQAAAATSGAHGSGRSSIPVAPASIRQWKHLRCARTRIGANRGQTVFAAARRSPAHSGLARAARFSNAPHALANADRRLHRSPALRASARPLVLPDGEPAARPRRADRSYEPHLPLGQSRVLLRAMLRVPLTCTQLRRLPAA